MSSPFKTVGASVEDAVRDAIVAAIPGASAEVRGSGGHFAIKVVSEAFDGKSLLQKQRLVYRAIAPFMDGPNAPVHSVDTLETLTP